MRAYLSPGTLAVPAFLAAMAEPHAAQVALPLLGVLGAWAIVRGEVDAAGRIDAVEWALIVFTLAWLLSASAGLDPKRSLLLSFPMLAALLGVFLVRRSREGARARDAADATLFALALWQCVAVLRAWSPELAPQELARRSDALWLVEPNDIAWVACTWPLLLRLRIAEARDTRIVVLALAAVAVMIAAMLVLQSRLALVLSVFVLAVLSGRSAARILATAAILSGALALLAWALDFGVAHKDLATVASRAQLWQAASAMLRDMPWTGAGPHNFVLAYGQYLPSGTAIDPRTTPWPHSLVLELLACTGVLGLLAAVLLVFAAFFQARVVSVFSAGRARGLLIQALAFAVLALGEASFLRIWVWMVVASLLWQLDRRGDMGAA